MGESLLLSDDLQATDLLWEFCFRTAFTIMSLFYSYVLFRFLFTSSKPYRAMIVYVFILFLLNTLVAWGGSSP